MEVLAGVPNKNLIIRVPILGSQNKNAGEIEQFSSSLTNIGIILQEKLELQKLAFCKHIY